MNSQEESLKRPLPIQLVAYHIYLRILHSGMTAEAILKLDDVAFGRFFAQALQITCDAGLVPYQRDFVPGLAVSMTGGLKVQPRGTENMVSPPLLDVSRVAGACLTACVFAGTAMWSQSVPGKDRPSLVPHCCAAQGNPPGPAGGDGGLHTQHVYRQGVGARPPH